MKTVSPRTYPLLVLMWASAVPSLGPAHAVGPAWRVPAPARAAIPVVEVVATRREGLDRAATGVVSLDPAGAARLPNATDDALRMVRLLPGVHADETGVDFHMRGGGTDETLVRMDGLELRTLFHGRDYGGVTSLVPAAAVSGVDVYPGGFPARYGGKLSGVVDVALRQDGPPGLHGTVGVDAVSARTFVEVHGQPASLQLSVREGYLDRVLRAVHDGFSAESGYRDLLVRAVHHPDAQASLSLSYLRSEDHIFYDDGIALHDVNSDYLDHYLWSTARISGAAVSVDATVHWAQTSQLRLLGADDRDDQDVERAGARAEATLSPVTGHVLTVGGSVEHEAGEFSYSDDEVVLVEADGSSRIVDDYSESGSFGRTLTAWFVQDAWKLAPRVALNVGARVQDGIAPRASGAIQMPGELTLTAAWGVATQPPRVAADLEAAVQIRSERTNRAVHRVIGLEKRWGAVRVGLDGWDKDFTAVDGVVTRTTSGGLVRHVIREGYARGVEAHAHRSAGSSDWRIAYTLGSTRWGTGRTEFTRDFDRLHALSLAGTFSLARGWDLGCTYSYHSGTPYTEQSWRIDDFRRHWVLEESEPNSGRLPAYQRLDLRVRRHFRFHGWELTAYAEGLNLTNHENVLWYAWKLQNEEGDRVPTRITRTGVPGLPFLGMEVRF